MRLVEDEIRWGIMCPLCYKVEYADSTGLEDVITHVDLAWLKAWRTSDLGPICTTCGRDRDDS